jgi:anaerobic magnesium-protoporphyrin IX monomethyl ester cyclase
MADSKKKILLIYPPTVVLNREDRCQQPVEELLVIPPLPPSDLMYMAAIAEKLDHECIIRDYSIDGESYEDFANDIKKIKPDYLIINIATPTLEADLECCKIAKEHHSDIITIAKGAYFLTFSTETLLDYPDLDLIIRGEPELTLREILSGVPLNNIQGLTFRDNGQPVNNPDRAFNNNLDDLPYPARHLVDMTRYKRPDNGKLQAVIKVSRGCPFHCFFCLATPVSGKKVRMRSPENILGEIKECVEKYKINDFLFWSDIFNLDRDWVTALCNVIINSGLKITWGANTRADTADLETAKLMYRAGCRLVSIGVESGSQEMLDKMGKKITLNQIRSTVKTFKKTGIKTYNYFVIGLPWETRQTAEETIKFAIELNSNFISFYTAVAFPGSRFYNYVQENHLFDTANNRELYTKAYYYPVVKSHNLSKDEIFELHKKAVKRFYLRPRFIINSLLSIRSFQELKNYFLAGLALLRKK